jgi:hypothetical protein
VAFVLALLVPLTVAPLSRAQLENFTYYLGDSSSVEGGKVPLRNGKWTDPEGGNTFSLHALHALGDLDRDGEGDAVAILVEATQGTGTFYYLLAIMNRDSQPVQLGEPEWLGDRTVVQRLTIDRNGIVTVRYITHGDNDPACCPTMKIEDRYRVVDGKLVGITK